MEAGNRSHHLFIDFIKTYDNVPIAKRCDVLKEMSTNQNIIIVIQEL